MWRGKPVSALEEIKASELSRDDYLLISDRSAQESKKMTVGEFMKYLRQHIDDDDGNPEWRCLRCGAFVDMEKFRCECTESPSPWERV